MGQRGHTLLQPLSAAAKELALAVLSDRMAQGVELLARLVRILLGLEALDADEGGSRGAWPWIEVLAQVTAKVPGHGVCVGQVV